MRGSKGVALHFFDTTVLRDCPSSESAIWPPHLLVEAVDVPLRCRALRHLCRRGLLQKCNWAFEGLLMLLCVLCHACLLILLELLILEFLFLELLSV